MILAHDFKRFLGLDRFMSVEVTLILDMDKVRSMVNEETTTCEHITVRGLSS